MVSISALSLGLGIDVPKMSPLPDSDNLWLNKASVSL